MHDILDLLKEPRFRPQPKEVFSIIKNLPRDSNATPAQLKDDAQVVLIADQGTNPSSLITVVKCGYVFKTSYVNFGKSNLPSHF